MPHQRQVIRKAVQAALIAENTAAATRVYATRMVPWEEADLPAISVYTLEETVDPDSAQSAPLELDRNLPLTIEAILMADEDVDDAIDAFSVQIERAMNRDDTFGRQAAFSMLGSTEIGLEMIGSRPCGVLKLTYNFLYRTNVPEDADTEFDDLNTVDVKTTVGGQIDPTEDLIDLEP